MMDNAWTSNHWQAHSGEVNDQLYNFPMICPVNVYANKHGAAASIKLTPWSNDVANPTNTHTPNTSDAYRLSIVTSCCLASRSTLFMTSSRSIPWGLSRSHFSSNMRCMAAVKAGGFGQVWVVDQRRMCHAARVALPPAMALRNEMKWYRTVCVSSSARPKSRRMRSKGLDYFDCLVFLEGIVLLRLFVGCYFEGWFALYAPAGTTYICCEYMLWILLLF